MKSSPVSSSWLDNWLVCGNSILTAEADVPLNITEWGFNYSESAVRQIIIETQFKGPETSIYVKLLDNGQIQVLCNIEQVVAEK